MQGIRSSIRGLYRDVLEGPGAKLIHDSGWVSNTIVNGCHILLAEFISNATLPDGNKPSAGGIQYLALGRGREDWDTGGAPAASPDVDRLEDPYRQHLAPLNWVYLDSQDQEVAGPTDRLQVTAILAPGFPEDGACPLREFGLFASLGGQDWMVNVIRHPVIIKEAQMTLTRVVRLYF
jgi:hypothetical protein